MDRPPPDPPDTPPSEPLEPSQPDLWDATRFDPAGTPVPPPGHGHDPSSGLPGPPWLLPALGGLAALVLVVGLIVWATNRGDGVGSPATTSTAAATSTTATASTTSTTPSTTSTSSSTTSSTTSTTSTTSTSTTSTSAPAPTTTLPGPPAGPTWTVTSPMLGDQPITLTRVAEADGFAAYDGAVGLGTSTLRCVAVVRDGAETWQESCLEAGAPLTLVAVDGIDPWLVELGADVGTVTLTRRDPRWAAAANGCGTPMSSLLGAPGEGLDAAMAASVVCVPGQAFVVFPSVLLQPGPVDGAGMVLTEGDEGWNVLNVGTSIDCADPGDGVDRCALYGLPAGSELFSAALPLPPADLVSASPDIVDVRDETTTVIDWAAGATALDAIQSALVAELDDPEAEVPAAVTRRDQVAGRELSLLVVDVPAFDDAVLSTTWAVWIATPGDGPASIVRATAWSTCARGLSGDVCL